LIILNSSYSHTFNILYKESNEFIRERKIERRERGEREEREREK